MNVYFRQCYIVFGASFPFSHHFQYRITDEITAAVEPSAKFLETYGGDFDLTFNISAKKIIEDNEIRGPTVYKKTKDVEYTVFLPFDTISLSSEVHQSALNFLLKGVCSVLESLGIATRRIAEKQEMIITSICSDPIMFQDGCPSPSSSYNRTE